MSDEPTPSFGERLEAARQLAGLSKAATCRLLDIAVASYANYEKNRTTPPPDRQAEMLAKLAEALNRPEVAAPLPAAPETENTAPVDPPDEDVDNLPDAGAEVPPVAKPPVPVPQKDETLTSIGNAMARFFTAPPAPLPAPPPVEYAPRRHVASIPVITKLYQSPVAPVKPAAPAPTKLVWNR